MGSERKSQDKELYGQLRRLSCRELWEVEVPAFDRATPEERLERVGLVRAVGVVFSETGNAAQRDAARTWLRGLLKDPAEKIRRYAMTALPKLGAGKGEEAELIGLLERTQESREKKFLGQALAKIGGEAALRALQSTGDKALGSVAQKLQANVVRAEQGTQISLTHELANPQGITIHLHTRRGLERMVKAEVDESVRLKAKFKPGKVGYSFVELLPVASFSLQDVYALRCFGSVGVVLGRTTKSESEVETLARIIASPMVQRVCRSFTDGAIRYRLDFVGQGHQRGLVRALADRVFQLCPELLNDAREAPWTVSIYQEGRGQRVELSPRAAVDPRFTYRQEDVPAASHPPLAACMVQLAGRMQNEVVWDPFCGSGVELIESCLRGGVNTVYGTDLSAEALRGAEENFQAAKLTSLKRQFFCTDFREFPRASGLAPGSLSLIISNPPLGKRVPVPNLRCLIYDLFQMAAEMLRPGGRLVFANPVWMDNPHSAFKLETRLTVDFGGFDCRVEKYVKGARR